MNTTTGTASRHHNDPCKCRTNAENVVTVVEHTTRRVRIPP
jgi:hypothetical protein